MNELFDKLISNDYILGETDFIGVLETQALIEHDVQMFDTFSSSVDHYKFIKELSKIYSPSLMIKEYDYYMSYYYNFKRLFSSRFISSNAHTRSSDVLYVLYMSIVHPDRVSRNEFGLVSDLNYNALTFQFDIDRRYSFNQELCTKLTNLVIMDEYSDLSSMYLLDREYGEYESDDSIFIPNDVITETYEDLTFYPEITKIKFI